MFSEELFQRLSFSALKWAENTNTDKYYLQKGNLTFKNLKVGHIVTFVFLYNVLFLLLHCMFCRRSLGPINFPSEFATSMSLDNAVVCSAVQLIALYCSLVKGSALNCIAAAK